MQLPPHGPRDSFRMLIHPRFALCLSTRTDNPDSNSTPDPPPDPQRFHLPHRHLVSCRLQTDLPAAALAGNTWVAVVLVDRIGLVEDHIGLGEDRTVPGPAHKGCCRNSLRWKTAGQVGYRSRAEGGHSLGLGRGSRRARGQRRGEWEEAIAGMKVADLGRISGMPLRRSVSVSVVEEICPSATSQEWCT